MKVLVGLGNPGTEHEETRHNVGFMVVDEIRRRHRGSRPERRARALVSRVQLGGAPVLLARPQTFMNDSGAAVVALVDLADADPGEILVMCDDIYLDLGALRLRPRGSHAGHNGLRSIIEALGTAEFPRLRIGVGPAEPKTPHAEFVLAPFPARDRRRVEEVVGRAADCAEMAATEGLARAMNRFNGRSDPGEAGERGAP